jgi:hypothetical protein
MTEAQQRELLLKMEALVNDSEASRKAIRDGIADLGVRLARLETKFDGGIITVDLCNEREKATMARISAVEKAHDGLVFWLRGLAIGLAVSLAASIVTLALR